MQSSRKNLEFVCYFSGQNAWFWRAFSQKLQVECASFFVILLSEKSRTLQKWQRLMRTVGAGTICVNMKEKRLMLGFCFNYLCKFCARKVGIQHWFPLEFHNKVLNSLPPLLRKTLENQLTLHTSLQLFLLVNKMDGFSSSVIVISLH